MGTDDCLVCFMVTSMTDGKEIVMRERVLERMKDELASYRLYLVSGALTAEQLFDEAYQIVMKQEIVEAMERLHRDNRLCEATWCWLSQKNTVLEYLYQLWMDCDFSLVSELMEVLYHEVEHDREVHSCE